jgi:ankyrin repeat protein
LHYAASNGDEEMVRLLLAHGANPLQRDKDDKSSLDLAFANGHAGVAKILLMHTRPDNIHPSTLSVAAAHGHVACVKMLLALGAPNSGSEQQEGPKSPQPWILESCSASLGKGYFPALHEAAAASHPSIVSLLLESGVDADAVTTDDMTPLHYAAFTYPARGYAVAKLLVEAGASVDKRTSMGMTSLHFAVQRGNDQLSRYLITKGAKFQARDNQGRSALQFAVANGRTTLVQILLDLGCDPMLKDNLGCTLLGVARLNDQETYHYLKQMLASYADNWELWERRAAKEPERTSWYDAIDRGRLAPAELPQDLQYSQPTTAPHVPLPYPFSHAIDPSQCVDFAV